MIRSFNFTYRIYILLLVLQLQGATLRGEDLYTLASSQAWEGYKRKQLPDGTYQPETYVFGNGGHLTIGVPEQTMDKLNFEDVARTLSIGLASQNYLVSLDPKTTQLLIMVYWGSSSGSRENPGLYHNQAMIDMNDHLNAMMLGFDSRARFSTPGHFERFDLMGELESNRYFVVLMAYDYQIMASKKLHRLLWLTRFSIREHKHDFTSELPSMARYAARFFGRDSEGMSMQKIGNGTVEIGPLKVLEMGDSK